MSFPEGKYKIQSVETGVYLAATSTPATDVTTTADEAQAGTFTVTSTPQAFTIKGSHNYLAEKVGHPKVQWAKDAFVWIIDVESIKHNTVYIGVPNKSDRYWLDRWHDGVGYKVDLRTKTNKDDGSKWRLIKV